MLYPSVRLVLALSLGVMTPLIPAHAAQTAASQGPNEAQVAAQKTVAARQAAAKAAIARNAARAAAAKAAATPAGPAKVAADAAATKAAADADELEAAARQAALDAATAVQAAQAAARQAALERQAAAREAALERQAAAQQAAQERQAAQAAARQAAVQQKTAPAVQSTAGTQQPAVVVVAPGAKPGSNSAGGSSVDGIITSLSNGTAAVMGRNQGSQNGPPGKGGPQGNALVATGSTQPAAGGKPGAGSAAAVSTAVLGVGQSGNTVLMVHGCERRAAQVWCHADISNQNKTNNQLSSSTAWTDAFITDDQGGLHQRTLSFFQNEAGEQRVEQEVPYGQSVHYVFVFDNVPANVSKISLHSAAGGMDVENIPVAAADAAASSSKH